MVPIPKESYGSRMAGMSLAHPYSEPASRFRWAPPRQGYCWITIPRRGRYLAEAAPGRSRTQTRPASVVGPLESRDLFRLFGSLKPTEREILRFANQHGWLGVGDEIPLLHHPRVMGRERLSAKPSNRLVRLGGGEMLEVWRPEILAMRDAVTVWTAVTKKDVKSLRQWLKIEEKDGQTRAWYERDSHRWRLIFDTSQEATSPGLSRLVRRGDWIQLARFLVQKLVDERLRAHVAYRMVYHADTEQMRAHPIPRNLLGALWFQLARTVEGLLGYQPCKRPGCPEWFEARRGRGKFPRQCCSTSCRVMMYQRRIAEASRLYAAGYSLDRIAARLGTKVETVRKWISRKPNGGQHRADRT
jgi:hypothetical protein